MTTGGTLVEVEAQITALRDAQRAHQAELQNAEQLLLAGLDARIKADHDVLVAETAIKQNRAAIHDYAELIDELIDERKALIPQPRPPSA